MLRDNLADSFYPYLENPRPTRPDPSLTEYVISPFQAEPAQMEILNQLTCDGDLLKKHFFLAV